MCRSVACMAGVSIYRPLVWSVSCVAVVVPPRSDRRESFNSASSRSRANRREEGSEGERRIEGVNGARK